MSLSITTVASTLSALVASAEATGKLYSYLAALMQAAEDAYSGLVDAGASKKAAVLAAVEALAATLGLVWDEIEAKVSAWIDSVKATYNALLSIDESTSTASA